MAGSNLFLVSLQKPSPIRQRHRWYRKADGVRTFHRPSSRSAWSDCYLSHRIAKEVAAERFRPNKTERRDMLGSFIRHGLTQREAQTELLLQM
jgi:hypothetical protein